MALLALILLAGSAAVVVDLLIENAGSQTIQAFGAHITMGRPGALVLAGAACGLLAAMAVMILHDGGVRRQRRIEARRAEEAERDELAAEARARREASVRDEDAAISGYAPSSDISTAEPAEPEARIRRRNVRT